MNDSDAVPESERYMGSMDRDLSYRLEKLYAIAPCLHESRNAARETLETRSAFFGAMRPLADLS